MRSRAEHETASGGRRLRYDPALDGVRAVAIALVLSFHAFQWPSGGFLGVHVFFVLSGFLITALLLQEWDSNGSISLLHFYRRRALRLVPALVALLLAYSAIQVVRRFVTDSSIELGAAMKGALISAFYVSNIFQAAGYVIATPLVHLWSLATEEQFYLLWPFVLLVGLRLRNRQRALELFLVAAIALIFVNRLFWGLEDARPVRLYYGPDTSFDAILIGCLLGIWFFSGRMPGPLRSRSFLRLAAVPSGLLVAATVVFARNDDVTFYWALLLPFLVATGLLLFYVASWEGSVLRKVLQAGPLVFVGRISYSLYLWHLLMLSLVRGYGGPRAILGLALAFGVATCSYFFVEKPFLRRKAQDRAAVERHRPRSRPSAGEVRLRERETLSA